MPMRLWMAIVDEKNASVPRLRELGNFADVYKFPDSMTSARDQLLDPISLDRRLSGKLVSHQKSRTRYTEAEANC